MNTTTPRELFTRKSGHAYLLRFPSGREEAAADAMARWAADPRLNFDWRDASTLGSELYPQLGNGR